MDLATQLALDILQFGVLFCVPGLSIVLQFRRPPETAIRILVYAMSTSILYVILVAALLLQLGAFSVNGLLITTAFPLAVAAARWTTTSKNVKSISLGLYTLIPCILVGGSVFVLLLLVTPRWNFLIAPNMDAGNYELYGNHFWKAGSFYLDGSSLLERGASPTWLASHNTWNIDPESGFGRPSYLPAYPILLGITKATFDSAVASPLVNALLASLSAVVMVQIGLQLIRARAVVVALVAGLVLTPMFFYYGKQFMAEELGLLGMLLIVHALLESRGLMADPDEEVSTGTATLGLSVGISFGLLSRLDFVPVLALLVAGLLVLRFDAWSRSGRAMPISFYLWPAVAATGASAVVGALGVASYLRHATPDTIEAVLDPRVFIPVYGLVAGAALLLAWALPVGLDRLERSVTKTTIIRCGQVLAVALSAAWIVFVLWNLFVRPFDSNPTSDAENLSRLFSVASPAILGATLLLSPLILIYNRPERGVAIMLIGGLAFAVYASQHSPLDLWWMRRYLLFVIPLGLIVLAGAIGQFRSRFSVSTTLIHAFAVMLFITAGVAAWNIRPLFAAEVNPDVPMRMAQLMQDLPTESFVVVMEGDGLLRGLANTYRSLTGHPVLVDVSQNDLKMATTLAEADQHIVLLSPMRLPGDLIDALRMGNEIDRGTVERQWSDWLAEIYANPRPSEAAHYFIYHESVNSQDG